MNKIRVILILVFVTTTTILYVIPEIPEEAKNITLTKEEILAKIHEAQEKGKRMGSELYYQYLDIHSSGPAPPNFETNFYGRWRPTKYYVYNADISSEKAEQEFREASDFFFDDKELIYLDNVGDRYITNEVITNLKYVFEEILTEYWTDGISDGFMGTYGENPNSYSSLWLGCGAIYEHDRKYKMVMDIKGDFTYEQDGETYNPYEGTKIIKAGTVKSLTYEVFEIIDFDTLTTVAGWGCDWIEYKRVKDKGDIVEKANNERKIKQANTKGEGEYLKGNYKEAEKYFLQVIELDKENVRAFLNLSVTKLKQGEYREGGVYAKHAILYSKNDNDRAKGYYNLGLAYESLREEEYVYGSSKYSAFESYEKSYKLRKNKRVLEKINKLRKNKRVLEKIKKLERK